MVDTNVSIVQSSIYNSVFRDTTTKSIFEFEYSPSTCYVVILPRYCEFAFCVKDSLFKIAHKLTHALSMINIIHHGPQMCMYDICSVGS